MDDDVETTEGDRDRDIWTERQRARKSGRFEEICSQREKFKIGLELVINDKHEESIYNLHQLFYKLLQIALIASLIQTEACGRGGGARPHTNLFTGLKWR